MPTKLPFSICSETPSTAARVPKFLERASISSIKTPGPLWRASLGGLSRSISAGR